MSFGSMLAGLVQAHVKFVVVGGVAGALHGAERVTNDLDIVYDALDQANVRSLADLLATWEAYPREVERGLPFIMDHRTLHSAPTLTLVTREGDLDVLDRVEGVGDYAAAAKRSDLVEAFGIEFRILDLPTLIRAKRATGRPKDREALLELEVLRAERRMA
jgi:hypothetical protein